MASFTIPERNYPANLRRESQGVNLPEQATHVQIVISSSEWEEKAGQGSVYWGVEYSQDGSSWQLLVATTTPIGYKPKGIYMPSIGFTTGGPAMTGEVRLFAVPTVSIRLGAQVTTSTVF